MKSKLLSVYLKIQEWTDAVGTDGNLVNNTLSYIKFGNGIDSVDEIVKTESETKARLCDSYLYQ